VYGSVARGEEAASSDVDLMVVGEVSFAEVVTALGDSETKLGREVKSNRTRAPRVSRKAFHQESLLWTVAKEKKLFVIGDENKFRRLGK
jgi:predicted nucleotidyltransferase